MSVEESLFRTVPKDELNYLLWHELLPEEMIEKHAHENMEETVILGRGEYEVFFNETTERVIVSEGEWIVRKFPVRSVHGLRNTGSAPVKYFVVRRVIDSEPVIVSNVKELPIAANVCNQLLREAYKKEDVSIAHVVMEEGNESLLHEHKKTKEVYFIIKGEGVFILGSKEFMVREGSLVEIPRNTRHKLKNTGKGVLEHLVISSPGFKPEDVFVVKGDEE